MTSNENNTRELYLYIYLGNENIHTITEQGEYTLRVDMEDFEGNTASVEYTHFAVGPESDQYRLKVGAYSGDMGKDFHNVLIHSLHSY